MCQLGSRTKRATDYGLNLKTKEPSVSLLLELDFLMALVTAMVADALVTTTAMANTSNLCVRELKRHCGNKGVVFLSFLRGINEFCFDSQLPLTTKIAGIHRRLKGTSPVSRPDALDKRRWIHQRLVNPDGRSQSGKERIMRKRRKERKARA